MDRPYTYDAAGQRNTETTPDHARTFTYDAQRQLVDATGTVGTTGTEQFDFTFDGIGNRQSSSLSTLNSQLSTSYATNPVNQYTALTGALADTPTYDANGNTTGLSGKLLAYDEENRLKQVSDTARTVTYIYDGLGRQVERIDSVVGGATTGTRYVYDGWRAVEELASSSSTWALSCSYTRGIDLSRTPEGAGGIGGLLARATPNGGTWTAATYAYDGNGNVTDLFNDNGINAAHYTYGPFGERLTATGALADVNTVQFSSKERDAFTAFYYYGLRYYNPSTGRWLSRDPIAEKGGVNLYGMVGNNPINWVDSLGLDSNASTFRIGPFSSTSFSDSFNSLTPEEQDATRVHEDVHAYDPNQQTLNKLYHKDHELDATIKEINYIKGRMAALDLAINAERKKTCPDKVLIHELGIQKGNYLKALINAETNLDFYRSHSRLEVLIDAAQY